MSRTSGERNGSAKVGRAPWPASSSRTVVRPGLFKREGNERTAQTNAEFKERLARLYEDIEKGADVAADEGIDVVTPHTVEGMTQLIRERPEDHPGRTEVTIDVVDPGLDPTHPAGEGLRLETYADYRSPYRYLCNREDPSLHGLTSELLDLCRASDAAAPFPFNNPRKLGRIIASLSDVSTNADRAQLRKTPNELARRILIPWQPAHYIESE